jgi:hypothetical protein
LRCIVDARNGHKHNSRGENEKGNIVKTATVTSFATAVLTLAIAAADFFHSTLVYAGLK